MVVPVRHEGDAPHSDSDTVLTFDGHCTENVSLLEQAQKQRNLKAYEKEYLSKYGGISYGAIVPPAGEKKHHRRRLSSVTPESEQITLSWHNLNVYAPPEKTGCCGSSPDGHKQILHDVSGLVAPGTLLAILGASGAGKTTLLNILTYRNRGNLLVQGDVRVNGRQAGKGLSKMSAYCQQDDLFIGSLTVREHLWFQAMLRMDEDIDYDDRMMRIEEVMIEHGLQKCADTMIGYPGRVKGISGGEMKRLSFASEVLTNPPLMFCDEPTSGLDSFMAESVVQTLKNMAAKGKTIICTIHQPSSETYTLFDRLLLMAEGQVAYLGPANQALGFFSSQGYSCPVNFNPADYFVHTLAIMPGLEYQCRQRVQKVCEAYQQSPQCEDLNDHLGKLSPLLDESYFVDTMASTSPYKASWMKQFRAVLWRSFVADVRNPGVIKARFFQAFVIALMIGLIYLNQSYDQKGVMNINGAMFLFQTQMSFGNLFAVINSFPWEYPVFLREHHNGMYRVDVYFLCKSLAELPQFIALPVMFAGLPYWMIGLFPSAKAFFMIVGTITFVANISVSCGYMVSAAAASSIGTALAVAPVVIVPIMMFGGFYLNDASVPVYFVWLQHLSWFKYSNENCQIAQWIDVTNITCEYIPPMNASLTGDMELIDAPNCLADGLQVLESYSYDPNNLMRNFLALAALFVGFRLVAFFCLLFRARKK